MSEVNLDEVRSWAERAGKIAMSHFRRLNVRRKADRSLVTQADVEIEQFITERISATYPEHGIIGEEHTQQDLDRPFVWAIDPVDGTSAFVAGLASWGVSLGLLHNRQSYAGVIYLPMTSDTYWAAPGGEALMNGDPIHVAPDRGWDSEDWIAIPSDSASGVRHQLSWQNMGAWEHGCAVWLCGAWPCHRRACYQRVDLGYCGRHGVA